MKVLVTASSKYEATGEIARAIGDVLAERGLMALRAQEGDFRDWTAIKSLGFSDLDVLTE